jgi:hypothetical protein
MIRTHSGFAASFRPDFAVFQQYGNGVDESVYGTVDASSALVGMRSDPYQDSTEKSLI